MREEPEGFAKLITVVNNFGGGALSEATLPGVRKTVLSLIGYFDLDANRALDIILDRSARDISHISFPVRGSEVLRTFTSSLCFRLAALRRPVSPWIVRCSLRAASSPSRTTQPTSHF